jgi:FixJ family two-component response regulator
MPETLVAIIDDDDGFRGSLEFMLASMDYQVASFASAADFLADPALRPTCVIVDQHMPGMSGLELATRLGEAGRDVPLRLMTAAPSHDILARADELGIGPVLVKPFDEEDLLKFITSIPEM